jgi:hypothetical protein
VLVLNDIEDLLTRARAALQTPEPESQSFFRVLPKEVPVPVPRTNYGGYSREADKFVVRMPDFMRERMAKFARLHFRSMNSECLVAMEWWMDRQTLMWAMLQATERELSIQESISKDATETTLDLWAERHPEAKETIEQLRALLCVD